MYGLKGCIKTYYIQSLFHFIAFNLVINIDAEKRFPNRLLSLTKTLFEAAPEALGW